MQVRAEKLPMSCQANSVLFTQEMSCCFSMCFKLKKKKPSAAFMNKYLFIMSIMHSSNVPLAVHYIYGSGI